MALLHATPLKRLTQSRRQVISEQAQRTSGSLFLFFSQEMLLYRVVFLSRSEDQIQALLCHTPESVHMPYGRVLLWDGLGRGSTVVVTEEALRLRGAPPEEDRPSALP